LVEGRKERKAIRLKRRAAKAAKKAEKKQAKAEAKTLVAQPVAAEAPNKQPAAVAEVVTEEVSEDAIADAIAESFAPAQPAETPNLSWSISQDEVELDTEATMQWNEVKTETAPIAAIQPADESLDFLTSENPIISEPSKQDLKAQKKAEKAELKAQKKAAKNSRHSDD
jgi:HAE1 family hydrophobic/amphiphilic exporter-1